MIYILHTDTGMRIKMKIRLMFMILVIIGVLWISIKMARAWVGDSSSPHPLMGSQLIQHSLFNRLIK